MSVSKPRVSRKTKLADARKRIEGKKKPTVGFKSGSSVVDRYRRTGGFGMSQGQKTKLALEKKNKRDAAIAKRKAQEAKVTKKQPKNLLREEGPGQGTTPSRRELTEQRAAKSRPKIKEQAKQLKIKAEDKSKFVKGGRRAAQKRAQENVGTAASLLIGGPALGFGIKAVLGGFKLGDKIYKTVSAARKAANKAKAKPQPKVKAETKTATSSSVEKTPTLMQRLKTILKPKKKKVKKRETKKKDNGRSSTEKTTDAATKHRERLAEGATKGRGKGTGTSTTTKTQTAKPTVSLKDRMFARPINTKTGKPYGPRSAKYKNWRNKVDKYKARGKGAAKLGAAGAAGYGLSELLRDRKPGQKPKPPTDRFQGAVKTTAKPKTKITSPQPKKKVLGGRGKVTEKPGARAAAAAASDAARRTYTPKTSGGLADISKRRAKTYGGELKPQTLEQKLRSKFLKGRRGRGSESEWQTELFNWREGAEGGKTYTDQQNYEKIIEERKRLAKKKRKGGVVAKSKGGMVRFSTGGRVLDTYDYN